MTVSAAAESLIAEMREVGIYRTPDDQEHGGPVGTLGEDLNLVWTGPVCLLNNNTNERIDTNGYFVSAIYAAVNESNEREGVPYGGCVRFVDTHTDDEVIALLQTLI